MPGSLTYTKIEQQTLTPVVGASIAPNVPDAYQAIREVDGVRFYVAGSKPWAAALWKASVALLPMSAPFTITMAWEMALDDSPDLNSAEMDLMCSDSLGNVWNGSTHLLIATGAMEIVNAAGNWTATPFVPGVPAPGLFVPYSATLIINPATGLSAVANLSAGQQSASLVPLQIPALKLGWAPNQAVTQIQPGLGQAGGACSVKIRNISVAVNW